MLNLNDLFFFVQAVEAGGFSAAARLLGLPKSTISKRVSELEAALGARLIHRTSRSFTLTSVGLEFFDHARASVIEAESAQSVIQRRAAEPSGTVRVTASVPTAQFYLAAHLPALAMAYPKLHLQIHVSDRFVDLAQEGFDMAVRSHFAPLPDSALMQRKISVDPIILVAASSYLERRGLPTEPGDLSRHDGLLTTPAATEWRLRSGDREQRVSPLARMTADESLVLTGAAAAGLGIACLPDWICRSQIAEGKLVQVLPNWIAGSVTTTMLMTHRRGQLPGVRAVVEFLIDRLGMRTTTAA